MRKILWNIYFWPMFALVSMVSAISILLVVPVQAGFFRTSFRSALRRQIRWYGWTLTQFLPFFAPVEVEYEQPLPPVSILVANHNSAIDPYLFGSLPLESGFVTSWPFRIPVYGWVMRAAGYANAEQGWEAVKVKCQEMLDEGCSVLIWPEGHRSRTGALGRFRNGAFSLAVESCVPVVPVCILGAREILAPGQRMLNCGRVKMIVLGAVYPDANPENKIQAIVDLRIRVSRMIGSTLEKHGHFSAMEKTS